jgi:hypothetical protein
MGCLEISATLITVPIEISATLITVPIEISATLITVPIDISISAICGIDISWEQGKSEIDGPLYDADGRKLLIQNQ